MMNEEMAHSRLLARLNTLRKFGEEAGDGITRDFGSAAEQEARQWFLEEAGASLQTRVDAAGNLWALYPGQTPGVLACGSHMDTVPHGGAYDGALGVVMALEAVQQLQESGYQPKHTLGVVVFTGEEPNSFRLSTLGSRLLSGVLSFEDIAGVRDDSGRLALDALREGMAPPPGADLLESSCLQGLIEPHIEQGPRLAILGQPLAVVTEITGIVRHSIVLEGEQNHAGTTPWADRRDAVQAFGPAMEIFSGWLARYRAEMTGTVGFVTVYPNAINIVPSRVEFIVEWRSPREDLLESVPEAYWRDLEKLGERLKIGTRRQIILQQAPSTLDPDLRELLSQTLKAKGVAAHAMFSWAGHDAAHVARKRPAAMLFVRSNGYSHCAAEDCEVSDMLLASDVLTDFMRHWDRKAPMLAPEGATC
jgi:N-carbamoyl-L-amino-acid hydrolase